jgi:hypothetical protein
VRDENSQIASYPVVFLYRHAIETLIKAVLLDFGVKSRVDATEVRKRGHDLSAQLADVDTVARVVGLELSARCRSVIIELNTGDKNNTRFRYDEALPHYSRLDLEHFTNEVELALDEI